MIQVEKSLPSKGYWRVPGTLWKWLQILGVKDIDVAEKKVGKTKAVQSVEEIAWHLWRKARYEMKVRFLTTARREAHRKEDHPVFNTSLTKSSVIRYIGALPDLTLEM
jgi:hypothetical protein